MTWSGAQAVSRPSYLVDVERDGRLWFIRVPELPGVFTQARRIEDVDRMARDAIALVLGVPKDSFDLGVRIQPPTPAGEAISAARAARATAEWESKRASAWLRRAVRDSMTAGLPIRDIGALLGISHQRVAQIAAAKGDPLSEAMLDSEMARGSAAIGEGQPDREAGSVNSAGGAKVPAPSTPKRTAHR